MTTGTGSSQKTLHIICMKLKLTTGNLTVY